MQICPLQPNDLADLPEIDATIESREYLHLLREGEDFDITWTLEVRPLREPLFQTNMPGDDLAFAYKQVTSDIIEGAALGVEAGGELVAALLAEDRPERKLIEIRDLRVDSDHRRQGLASAMLFQLITTARDRGLRAVACRTRANQQPANTLLNKLGFDLRGLDECRYTNHDVVKEAATLQWYLLLD